MFLTPLKVVKGACKCLDEFVGVKLHTDVLVAIEQEMSERDNG